MDGRGEIRSGILVFGDEDRGRWFEIEDDLNMLCRLIRMMMFCVWQYNWRVE